MCSKYTATVSLVKTIDNNNLGGFNTIIGKQFDGDNWTVINTARKTPLLAVTGYKVKPLQFNHQNRGL